MKSDLLKAERRKRGWTQAKVAEAVGVDAKTVGRWERGKAIPYPYYREQLCILFGKNAEQLGLLYGDNAFEEAVFLGVQSSVPDVAVQAPLLVDPIIPQILESADSLVGRDSLLMQIKERLFAGDSLALTAVDSLPGIGKTTLAAILATDPQVQAHFCDGILWAGLGLRPNVLGHLVRWGKLLGIIPSQVKAINSRQAWSQALQAAIGTRRMLLIIDDAWTVEDALALQVEGTACAYMLTTCLSEVARAFDQGGSITVPELEETDGIALLTRFVPQLVEQDPQGAQALVQAVGGLPLALTLMGSYLASPALTAQSEPLRMALALLYDTQECLRANMPKIIEEGSPRLEETMPLSLHATIAMCDQQLSPQAHATLCTLVIFLPKPESFSREAALAVTQQPIEMLDALCDARLLEVCGPGHYVLHQAVAKYARDQSQVPTRQKRLLSSPGKGIQLHEWKKHSSADHRSWPRVLCTIPIKSVSTFGPFKRFSWRSWSILSIISLVILVITVGLLAFNSPLFPRSESPTGVSSSTVYEAEAPGSTLAGRARPQRVGAIPHIISERSSASALGWLQTAIIDDRIQGTGTNQFNYVGNGWQHCPSGQSPCGETPILYNGTNSWDNVIDDYITITFTGVQITFYGVLDSMHGMGAISIDGGGEMMIDFYTPSRVGDQLMWISPAMPEGTHTFKLRVTGNKNPSSSNTFVAVDRVDILG